MSTQFAISDLYQFIGFVSIIITILVGVIQRDRASQKEIYLIRESLKQECSNINNALHREVSEIREEFVKKVDFEKHFAKIENNIERIHFRLDDILNRLMAKS